MSYALFVNKPEIARQVAELVPKRRIDTQIKADGTQPEELSRANSWDYCCENLRNFTRLAKLARHVDVDLWSYSKKDGRSIKKAIDYLLPFVAGEAWPHKQQGEFQAWRLKAALLAAPQSMGYASMAFKMLSKSSIERLLHVPPTETKPTKAAKPDKAEPSDAKVIVEESSPEVLEAPPAPS